ncbi:hypothetical protein [Xanthomarina gelatinilytica]|uniref:hypothetical protein n=1 Tax=Xanthomarina gelatinilytica TaxID=1137281 RepID=UPI003AA928AD
MMKKNRISEIIFEDGGPATLKLEYNADDLISKMYVNAIIFREFSYVDNRLSAMSAFDEMGNFTEETTFSFNDGHYLSTSGTTYDFKVDNQNQLLTYFNETFAYTSNSGVHKYLKLQPALYILEDITFIALYFGNNEWIDYSVSATNYDLNNTRDDNNNIVNISLSNSEDDIPIATWTISL